MTRSSSCAHESKRVEYSVKTTPFSRRPGFASFCVSGRAQFLDFSLICLLINACLQPPSISLKGIKKGVRHARLLLSDIYTSIAAQADRPVEKSFVVLLTMATNLRMTPFSHMSAHPFWLAAMWTMHWLACCRTTRSGSNRASANVPVTPANT
jgi:hypothetical protein